jgi:hypothetical protein
MLRALYPKLPYVIDSRFLVSVLQQADISAACMFAKHFWEQEPLCRYLNLPLATHQQDVANFIKENSNPMRAITIKTLKGGIVGFCMCPESKLNITAQGTTRTRDPRMLALLREADEKYRRYYQQQQFTGKVLKLSTIAVDPTVQGRNLAVHLNYACGLLAQEQGFGRLCATASNYFALRALLKTGFQIIGHIRYDDWVYKGPSGDGTPLRGLNEVFTVQVSKTRIGRKPILNAADCLSLTDATTDTVLNISIPI